MRCLKRWFHEWSKWTLFTERQVFDDVGYPIYVRRTYKRECAHCGRPQFKDFA